jgi:threonine dehydrogenase-like Zn-dependent dehydrogenase
MGAGTIGLLATLVLRQRGLDVTTFARSTKPYLNADLVEELGARYVSTKNTCILDGSRQYGPFDLIVEATGNSGVVFDRMQTLGKNGVLVLTSVTGGDKKIEVPCRQDQSGFSWKQGDGGQRERQPRVLRNWRS